MTSGPTWQGDVRAQLLSELGGPGDYGVLLVAQMGGTPNELQLIVETARFDEAAQGLRPRGGYIIRALGVREHQLHLGVFAQLAFLDEHPLLMHSNFPRAAVHFDGQPGNVSELVLDVFQAYVSIFGPWRNVAQIGDELNPSAPLVDLLSAGYGVLGVMPKPLAERMVKVLRHHGLNADAIEELGFEAQDEHGRSRLYKLLRIDTGYITALDFSVDPMRRK